MSSRILVSLVLVSFIFLSAPARADDDEQTPGDILFAIGQVTGSAALCKIAMADVNALVAKAFQALDLPLDQGSDSYKRFADGVTDGGKQVNSGAMKCNDAVAGFNA